MEQTIAFPTDSERDRDKEALSLRPFSTYNSQTLRGLDAAIIVAVADDGAIGCHGVMPWQIPGDLRYFKATTLGHPVVMGRTTWESLFVKPLPGRRNIVVSTTPGFNPEGAEKAASPEQALEMCVGGPMPFVIGGGRLYRDMLPYVSHIYLTRVHATYPQADTFFPALDPAEWTESPSTSAEAIKAAEAAGASADVPCCEFVVLRRKNG